MSKREWLMISHPVLYIGWWCHNDIIWAWPWLSTITLLTTTHHSPCVIDPSWVIHITHSAAAFPTIITVLQIVSDDNNTLTVCLSNNSDVPSICASVLQLVRDECTSDPKVPPCTLQFNGVCTDISLMYAPPSSSSFIMSHPAQCICHAPLTIRQADGLSMSALYV